MKGNIHNALGNPDESLASYESAAQDLQAAPEEYVADWKGVLNLKFAEYLKGMKDYKGAQYDNLFVSKNRDLNFARLTTFLAHFSTKASSVSNCRTPFPPKLISPGRYTGKPSRTKPKGARSWAKPSKRPRKKRGSPSEKPENVP